MLYLAFTILYKYEWDGNIPDKSMIPDVLFLLYKLKIFLGFMIKGVSVLFIDNSLQNLRKKDEDLGRKKENVQFCDLLCCVKIIIVIVSPFVVIVFRHVKHSGATK